MNVAENVALIVPCHDYGRYVEELLLSIAGQTFRPAEVVVIDDGSTDGSPEVVGRLRDQLAGVLDLRLVCQPHLGLAEAVRRGMSETASPLVAIVGADDRLTPRYVEVLSAALAADPAAGFAYPRMRMFGDEEGVVATYPFDVDRLLFDHNYVPGVAMMRRVAYLAAGGLSDLPVHEDWDLILALAERGWPGVLVPEVLYEWRRHPLARNHADLTRRLTARVRILARHWRLVARRAHMALPWTGYAVLRRVAARSPRRSVRARRSTSAWVEVP